MTHCKLKNTNRKGAPLFPGNPSPLFYCFSFWEYYSNESAEITEQNLKNVKKVPLTDKFVVLYMWIQTDSEYNPRKRG